MSQEKLTYSKIWFLKIVKFVAIPKEKTPISMFPIVFVFVQLLIQIWKQTNVMHFNFIPGDTSLK